MPLHLPLGSTNKTTSPYNFLGLRDLPFPSEPVVDPYNSDPRRNGSIYAEDTARDAIDKFERLLIRPDDFTNRVRLAYLWSKGDSQSGRGVGKTALLRYFRHRINNDWGQAEFQGQFSAAVIYVAFPNQVDRRYMEQLALSGLVDVCKNGILQASRAALRLKHLTAEDRQKALRGNNGVDDFDNLLRDQYLQEQGIQISEVDAAVEAELQAEGIKSDAAEALAGGTFEDYLRSFRKDGNLEPLYIPRDTKILDYSRSLLFNSVVQYLRCAGFAGGYLFIDDIENLVDQMARKDRIEFAKEFALCTVRPGYANTENNFFSSVITTHQQASVSLSQAWGEAGLAAIAPLSPGSPNSVELPFPSKDQARQIVIAHIDYYRLDQGEMDSIKPFTEDGMDALLQNRQTVHPRDMLARAANVVRYALEHKISVIDEACVKSAGDAGVPVSTPDFTEGIEGAV